MKCQIFTDTQLLEKCDNQACSFLSMVEENGYVPVCKAHLLDYINFIATGKVLMHNINSVTCYKKASS
jgi:hypothetical protein